IIHSNGIKTHLLTRGLDRSIPVLWHIRDFLGRRPFAGRLLRWAQHPGLTVIANSNAVREDARLVLRTGTDIRVVYNAIDTNVFSPAPARGAWLDELARAIASDDGSLRIGLVATYARWKGQMLFLEAVRELVRRGIAPARAKLYIVGGSVYRTTDSEFSED